MRQGSGSRRSRGRANGKRPFNQGGGGPNRSFESNGPGIKLRGTAAQVFEKYLALARDASSSGDRVAAENFYQHAEHYYRLHSTFNAERKLRTENERDAEDDLRESDGEDDDQGVTVVAKEQPAQSQQTEESEAEPKAKADEGDENAPAKPRRRRRSNAAKDTEAETVA